MNATIFAQRLEAAHVEAHELNEQYRSDDMKAERVPGGGVHWPHAHIRRWDYTMSMGPDQGGNYGIEQAYHWRGGMTFSRLKCGCVAICSWLPSWDAASHPDGARRWTCEVLAIIAEMEWASVVSSVSAEGESGGRWQSARDFHNGPCGDVAVRTSQGGET